MTKKKQKKRIFEGKYAAEVEIELIVTEDEWSPCLSLADAYKLDDVREALKREDIRAASALADVFTLTPVVI